MLRVILVDDHDLFCEGMRAILAREPDLTVVAKAHDAQEARRLFAEQPCDVGIVDVSLPTSNGNALVRDLRRHAPKLPLRCCRCTIFPMSSPTRSTPGPPATRSHEAELDSAC